MTNNAAKTPIADSILIVDGDVLSRHAISDYLRRCGYDVVEASGTSEAKIALKEPTLSLDIIVCDVAANNAEPGPELISWVKKHRPDLEVRLAGTPESIAGTAADLCEKGPHLARPYEPEAVVNYINRLRTAAAKR